MSRIPRLFWPLITTIILEFFLISLQVPETWLGVWPATTVVATLPIILSGAVWAGFTALERSVERPDALIELFSARSAILAHGQRVLRLWLTSLIPVFIGLAYASFRTLGQAGAGFIWWSYLVLAAINLLFCVSLGYLVGSVFAGWFSPLTASLVALIYLGAKWDLTSYVTTSYGYPDVTLNRVRVAILAGIATALFLLAITLPTTLAMRASRWAQPAQYAVPIGLGLVIAVAIVALHYSGPLQAGRQPPAATCHTGEVRVCLWPENSAWMDEVLALAERAQELSSYGLAMPTSLVESGLDELGPGDTEFSIKGGTTWFITGDWARAASYGLAEYCSDMSDEQMDSVSTSADELAAWIDNRLHPGARSPVQGGPLANPEEVWHFANNADEESQREWVHDRLATIEELSAICR